MAELHINSEKVQTVSTPEALYAFLIDFRNFASILPEDKVENFVATDNHCSFDIRGITKLTISVQEKEENKRIVYISNGLMKFDFTLDVRFFNEAEKSTATIAMLANLNPFIKAMAEKPLRQLVDSMANKLARMQVD